MTDDYKQGSEESLYITQNGTGYGLYINQDGIAGIRRIAIELLKELINTPILKIPFWIEGHKNEIMDARCDQGYELLVKAINVPITKINNWIKQHKRELKKLGINIEKGNSI
jgi:hypothetical protein